MWSTIRSWQSSRVGVAVRVQQVRARMQASASGRTAIRMMAGLVRIEWMDRSMTLAAQLFTSVLPVIIVGSVFVDWGYVSEGFTTQFGFDPAAFGSAGLFEPNSSAAAFGVVGLAMVVVGGTSFARALARIYARIWHVPTIGVRQAWRWLIVLLIVAVSVAVIALLRLSGMGMLAFMGEMVVWVGVWTLCPYLLTGGRLTGHALWWTGAMTAVLLTAVQAGGRVVLPRITVTAQMQFGVLGLVFTVISWLFVLSMVIVASPVIIQALAEDEGRIGKYIHATSPPTSTEPR